MKQVLEEAIERLLTLVASIVFAITAMFISASWAQDNLTEILFVFAIFASFSIIPGIVFVLTARVCSKLFGIPSMVWQRTDLRLVRLLLYQLFFYFCSSILIHWISVWIWARVVWIYAASNSACCFSKAVILLFNVE